MIRLHLFIYFSFIFWYFMENYCISCEIHAQHKNGVNTSETRTTSQMIFTVIRMDSEVISQAEPAKRKYAGVENINDRNLTEKLFGLFKALNLNVNNKLVDHLKLLQKEYNISKLETDGDWKYDAVENETYSHLLTAQYSTDIGKSKLMETTEGINFTKEYHTIYKTYPYQQTSQYDFDMVNNRLLKDKINGVNFHYDDAAAITEPSGLEYEDELQFRKGTQNRVNKISSLHKPAAATMISEEYSAPLPNNYKVVTRKSNSKTRARTQVAETTQACQESSTTKVKKGKTKTTSTTKKIMTTSATISRTKATTANTKVTKAKTETEKTVTSNPTTEATSTLKTDKPHKITLGPEEDFIVIRRVKGIWIGGQCRCNYFLRSKACRTNSNLNYLLHILNTALLLSCNNWL